MATVVFVHAHPDDEAILSAGTMAAMAAAGDRVVLVTATRGELGERPEGGLDDGESLAERRTRELAEAGRVLGVHRQVFLGYLDSGMAGEATNQAPGSFAAADVGEAAHRLAGLLTEEAADVLVTYDEHGSYGHPDHIQVHRVGMAAAELAGTPVVYLSTTDRDLMVGLARRIEDAAPGTVPTDTEGLAEMGEPRARLTSEVDVTGRLDVKRAAMRAHASQIAETSFFLAMDDALFAAVWGRECFIRVRPDPPVHDGPFEVELMTTVPAR